MKKQPRKSIIRNNEVSTLKEYTLGGYKQKVLIEGKTKNLPIMLCLHGGPGSPIPFSVGCRGLFPEFTNNFIMVYWDQLGCGINNYNIDNSFTIDNFVSMTIDLIKILKKEYPNNKLLLFGVSWGSILSAKATLYVPELIDAVVVYGQILKEVSLSKEVFDTLEKSSAKAKVKQKISEIHQKEKYSLSDFKAISKYVWKYTDGYQNKLEKQAPIGHIIWGLLTSPDYKFADFLAIVKNGYQKNESLFTELIEIDMSNVLKEIKKPYYIFQGSTDIVTSTKTMSDFIDSSDNKNLNYTIIANCGHLPNRNVMETLINTTIALSNK